MKRYYIKNWEQYQHYKKRNPPWIKLHFSLLASEDWVTLSDASRVLAVACMLLASRNKGYVNADPKYLKRVAYLNSLPDFTELLACGFLIEEDTLQADASKMLASACSSVSVSVLEDKVKEEVTLGDKGGVGEKGETPPPAPQQPEPAPAPITSAADIFQDLPKQLDTQQFRDEWRQWERYMRDTHGRPIGLMQRQPGWQMMVERAPAGQEAAFAVNTIRQAMAAGWKNLYPKQETNNERTGTPNNRRRTPTGGDYSGKDAERYSGEAVMRRVRVFDASQSQPAVQAG